MGNVPYNEQAKCLMAPLISSAAIICRDRFLEISAGDEYNENKQKEGGK